jgi:hypothetical protein
LSETFIWIWQIWTRQTNSIPIITVLSRAGYGKMTQMARKRKKKEFHAVQAVKALARERIGTPPGSRVVPDRKKTQRAKHKPSVAELLDDL